jgi:hypothetical protein
MLPDIQTDYDLVLEQHIELREMIRDLHAFLREPRPNVGSAGSLTWASTLAEKLTKFHAKLCGHFRLEERSGILEQLQRAFPRTAHQVEALRKDHDRILADLRAILGATLTYGEGKHPDNPQLRRWAASILDQLSEHEREETELFQRVHTEDIGAGD